MYLSQKDLKTLEKRCKTDSCWDYVLCDGDKCWDGLDIRSTLMRNINDARNTKFRNNSFFENRRGKIYVVASHNIITKLHIVKIDNKRSQAVQYFLIKFV